MTYRLATAADANLLDFLLKRMGQFWAPGVVADRMGMPDCFFLLQSDSAGQLTGAFMFVRNLPVASLVGPADGPVGSDSVTWFSAFLELGLEAMRLTEEQHPEWDYKKRVARFIVGPKAQAFAQGLDTHLGLLHTEQDSVRDYEVGWASLKRAMQKFLAAR